MAKTSGGVRTYQQGTSTYRKRQAEVEAMRASGRYSSVEIGKGGGYVAIEKSPARHKSEELEAARILADKGYKVVLKNESGQVRTPDGRIFSASFEQRTPTKDALIDSKGGVFTRQSVEKGIGLYEDGHRYRFKRIIIVSDNGYIHRYKHNK